MNLAETLNISAAGMKAQSDRLRMISENIANADSTGRTAEENPYRRQTITFKNTLDKELGYNTVQVSDRKKDMSDFQMRYMPTHPAANEDGYVKMPNVNPVMEMMDMREARRAYEANLNAVEISKTMLQRTLDLLR
jgi:flagellar basal-body rod protein FlgC